MERDAITFAVKNQRAETVGANLVFWLKHFAAVGLHNAHRLVQATLAVEVEQWTVSGGFGFVRVRGNQASADGTFLMRQHSEMHPRELLLLDGSSQHCGIKPNGPVQISNWHIEPDDLVRIGLLVFSGHKLFDFSRN